MGFIFFIRLPRLPSELNCTTKPSKIHSKQQLTKSLGLGLKNTKKSLGGNSDTIIFAYREIIFLNAANLGFYLYVFKLVFKPVFSTSTGLAVEGFQRYNVDKLMVYVDKLMVYVGKLMVLYVDTIFIWKHNG